MDSGYAYDHDMLFEDEALNPVSHFSALDSPQLDRLDRSERMINNIEAVLETVNDALLNERAEVTFYLTASVTVNTEHRTGRVQRAAFSFPGKTATEAWRFC